MAMESRAIAGGLSLSAEKKLSADHQLPGVPNAKVAEEVLLNKLTIHSHSIDPPVNSHSVAPGTAATAAHQQSLYAVTPVFNLLAIAAADCTIQLI